MADMRAISNIAHHANLAVIEDACEAHGASLDGVRVGHYGDMSCYSFYIAHLICCGEGGMVSTNHQDVYDSLIATRTHGRPGGALYFDHPYFGLNSKMNDLEASIGLEGIARFWDTYRKRKYNLYYLLSHLPDWYKENFYYNTEKHNEDVCPHGFSLTFKNPELGDTEYNKLACYLDSRSIKVKRNFGCIPTQHDCYAHYGHELGDFPVAEHIGNYGLHFGLHEYLTQTDLEYIIEVLTDYINL
jgi:dTDP-4-amino-4,6-dideoxygalactose transaminase